MAKGLYEDGNPVLGKGKNCGTCRFHDDHEDWCELHDQRRVRCNSCGDWKPKSGGRKTYHIGSWKK